MCGSMFMHVCVKNGLEESKLPGWFAGQLHKQLAHLRIWGFGGEWGGGGKKKWSGETKKREKSQRRGKMGLHWQQSFNSLSNTNSYKTTQTAQLAKEMSKNNPPWLN